MKKVLNVVGVLFSIVLTLALFIPLTAAPLISAVGTFLQPSTLQQLAVNLDYAELMEEAGISEALAAEYGVTEDVIRDLLETEAMSEAVTLYVSDLFLALEMDGSPASFNAENLKNILTEHMDELAPIFKVLMKTEMDEILSDYLGSTVGGALSGAIDITDDQVKLILTAMMDEIVQNIMDAVPSAQEVVLSVPELALYSEYVTLLRDGTILNICVAIAAVLSLLIFLCNALKPRGLAWLGVVYAIAGGYTIGFAQSLPSMPEVLLDSDPMVVAMVPVLETLGKSMQIGAYAYFGVCVAMFVAFAVYEVLRRKNRAVMQDAETAPERPAWEK